MSDALIADKRPAIVELQSGKAYFWCACGRSSNQPYCDGSHSGTAFNPIEFSVEEDRKAALCKCKRTGNSPYCDGTHSKL